MKPVLYLLFAFFYSCISFQNLAATATIEGTITDSVTGLPISGALIEAIRGGQVRYSNTTATDGTYSITGIEPSNYTLVASAAGYQTQSVGTKPNNNQTTIVDFALVPNGGTINGTVTDAITTIPISSATIRIFQGTSLIQLTTTNGSGLYSAPNLAPGSYIVQVEASGYQTQFKGASVQVSALTTVNFALASNPGSIAGTVIDAATTNPIVGAVVEVFDGSVLVGFSDTNGSGQYTISGLTPSSYTVTASAAGYQSTTVGASVLSNTTTTADFALNKAAGTISGTVTDALTGNPIRDASINVFQGLTFVASILTDTNGQYGIDGLAPDNYIVSANASSHQIQIKGAIVVVNSITLVNFSLSPNPGIISGQVTDATTTNPIASATINVYDGQALTATTVTDSNGNYTILNLAPGNFTVTASSANYQTQALGATVMAGTTTIVNFALLSNPGIISGQVTDAITTNPIPNATVAIFQGTTFIGFALTDVNGNYTIPDLAPGNYTVLAFAKGYQAAFSAEIVVAGSTTIADFALNGNPGTIAGTVTDRCMGNPVPGTLILVSNGSTIVGFGLTNSTGNYVIDTLAPGNYTVTAAKQNFLIGSSPAIVTANVTTTVSFILSPTIKPPASISGAVIKNKFLTQTELVHAIRWTASPSSCVTGYQIFRNDKQIAFVSSKSNLEYLDHNRRKKADIYSVKAMNAFGMVSNAISITLGCEAPKKKPKKSSS